jgi:hypothetical protein
LRLEDLSLLHCRELYHSHAFSVLPAAIAGTASPASVPEEAAAEPEEKELDFMIVDPLDSVTKSLAAALGQGLRCGSRVVGVKNWTALWPTALSSSKSPVVVEYVSTQSSDNVALYCDACVVTVPLGVLKANAIAFSPRLEDAAPAAAASIAALGFGVVAKVFASFEERWWAPLNAFSLAPALHDDSNKSNGGGDLASYMEISEPPLGYWVDVTALCGRPVLCAMVGASRSPEIEAVIAASAAAQDGDSLLRRLVDDSFRSAKVSGGKL